MDFLTSPAFWFALGQIILIDILLGGDNAVVIALACRKLPPQLRTKGILWGTAGAILLRVVLIAFAMTLLTLPFIKVLGALLLLWSLPYTNLAGKFNANSQLLSLWPWAAALLLASWQERGWRGACRWAWCAPSSSSPAW